MINVENISLEYFEDFKSKNNAKRYLEDCNDFDLRESIRNDLLIKQRYQCAYCERKITKEKSIIEHISPRDKAPLLECKYSNIVLSCKSDDSCDRFKDKNIWEDRYIHPVLNNPEESFYFSSNGQILGNDKDAKDTITFLNLDSNKLKRLRENIVLYSVPYVEDLEFEEHENLIKQFRKNN